MCSKATTKLNINSVASSNGEDFRFFRAFISGGMTESMVWRACQSKHISRTDRTHLLNDVGSVIVRLSYDS